MLRFLFLYYMIVALVIVSLIPLAVRTLFDSNGACLIDLFELDLFLNLNQTIICQYDYRIKE